MAEISLLRAVGLVRTRKSGRMVLYSLESTAFSALACFLNLALAPKQDKAD